MFFHFQRNVYSIFIKGVPRVELKALDGDALNAFCKNASTIFINNDNGLVTPKDQLGAIEYVEWLALENNPSVIAHLDIM